MNKKINTAFMLLIFIQGLHSVEEYLGRLYEVFFPARYLSNLVSEDIESGFIIINTGLFIFGLWCWFIPVRRNYAYARVLIWLWIILEIINGIGHPVWALIESKYVPGAATAPI